MAGFAQTLVELPNELKVVLAGLCLAAVQALLSGRVPDEVVSKFAALVTAFVLGIVEVALGMIPLEFEEVAVAILQLLVVLFGFVVAKNLFKQANERGLLN
jgi:hypothetical protein